MFHQHCLSLAKTSIEYDATVIQRSLVSILAWTYSEWKKAGREFSLTLHHKVLSVWKDGEIFSRKVIGEKQKLLIHPFCYNEEKNRKFWQKSVDDCGVVDDNDDNDNDVADDNDDNYGNDHEDDSNDTDNYNNGNDNDDNNNNDNHNHNDVDGKVNADDNDEDDGNNDYNSSNDDDNDESCDNDNNNSRSNSRNSCITIIVSSTSESTSTSGYFFCCFIKLECDTDQR